MFLYIYKTHSLVHNFNVFSHIAWFVPVLKNQILFGYFPDMKTNEKRQKTNC